MAEPLLLLPGMMCDDRLFAPQVARFSLDRTVMIPPLTGQDSFTGLATEILADAPPKFALAGLSMGGIAAMEIMRLAPERVTRLALMDTNHLPDAPVKAAGRERQIEKVRAGGLSDIMQNEMKPNYVAEGPGKEIILDLCMDMAEAHGPDVFVSQTRALQSRRDQSDTLKNITVPTLVLCGREDAFCPVKTHRRIHSLIPNSDLSIVEGAGHLPVLEQPEITNDILQAWLDRGD